MTLFDLVTFIANRDACRDAGETWVISAEELLATYAAGERDFANACLVGAKLVKANLTDATLAGANLVNANLADAALTGANLVNANLAAANLDNANLFDAQGVYSAGMSWQTPFYGGVVVEDGKVVLRLWDGDEPRTVAETKARAKSKQELFAINFIEATFDADMAEGQWDYLLSL